MSRALGDYQYKGNVGLGPEHQMVSGRRRVQEPALCSAPHRTHRPSFSPI